MKKIRLLALLILGFVAGTAMAQNIRVSGVVTSAEDGQTLPGVMVLVKGTNNGTGTAADGSYSLNNVPKDGTLVFRYVGMKTQEVAVNSRNTINVVMAVDALEARTVTVTTALGVKKQDRKIGYATTTVKGDELARTNTLNVANALQGKVAGVQVNSVGSGGVTSSPTILIRGAKSLDKNNSPIFVIDGIIMQNTTSDRGATDPSGDALYGNQLKNLNPDDYESVTVLKGAAATSLYGSRGANGAIVISTKRGKVRQGLGIEVSYTHEFQDLYQAPIDLQNKYGMGDFTSGAEGDYVDSWQSTTDGYYDAWSWGVPMRGQQMKQYYKGLDTPAEAYVAQKDAWKSLFQQGSYDQATIALTGGKESATYRLSYGYTSNKGVFPNNGFKRHSVNFSTTGKINDVLSTDFSIQYTNSAAKNPRNSSPYAWGRSPLMQTAYFVNRNTDLGWIADNFYDKTTYERKSLGMGDDANNAVLGWFNEALDNNETRKEQTIIARLQVNAQFTEWLDASASISYNDFRQNTETKNFGSGKYRDGGYYGIGGSTNGNYTGLAQVHFNKRFVDDNLEVDARVLGEIYGNTESTGFWKRTNGGLIAPGLFTFANSKNPIQYSDNGGDISAGLTPRNNMVIGVAGIVNISWKDQINLELTARNDWASSLLYPTWIPQGANNYSVFYPSANVSWVFSDTFKIDPNIISYGKLRASIAQVGMGTGAYSTASGAGGYSQGAMINPGGGSVIYANPNNATLPNYDLKPEIQQSIEFGADVRFLNNRIGVDVTYYKTNTYNQILSLKATPESGVGNRLINAGNIQNQGWEFQFDFTPIQSREVRWNIGLNVTRNRGKIIKLHEEVKNLEFMGPIDNGPAIYGFEGGPFGIVVAGGGYGAAQPIAYQQDPNKKGYGQKLLRINGGWNQVGYKPGAAFQYDGLRRITYTNTKQISGYYDNLPENERYTNLGNIEPDFYFGFNTSLTYKGFDFFAQIDGRKGGAVVTPLLRYARQNGSVESTLYGRDAEHGGLARTNYKGETVYNGMILDGVFQEGLDANKIKSFRTGEAVDLGGMTMAEAVKAGHIDPMLAAVAHFNTNSWGGTPAEGFVQDLTYVSLREITLGYNFPEKWVKHIGMQSARLAFSARNLCYIYNGLKDKTNPEAISNNNPLTPFDVSGVPFSRQFSLTLNVRF